MNKAIYSFILNMERTHEELLFTTEKETKTYSYVEGNIQAVKDFKEFVFKGYILGTDPLNEAEEEILLTEKALKAYEDIDELIVAYHKGYITMLKMIVKYSKE